MKLFFVLMCIAILLFFAFLTYKLLEKNNNKQNEDVIEAEFVPFKIDVIEETKDEEYVNSISSC